MSRTEDLVLGFMCITTVNFRISLAFGWALALDAFKKTFNALSIQSEHAFLQYIIDFALWTIVVVSLTLILILTPRRSVQLHAVAIEEPCRLM